MTKSDDYKKGYSKGYATGVKDRSESDYDRLNRDLKLVRKEFSERNRDFHSLLDICWKYLPSNCKDALILSHTDDVISSVRRLNNVDGEHDSQAAPLSIFSSFKIKGKIIPYRIGKIISDICNQYGRDYNDVCNVDRVAKEDLECRDAIWNELREMKLSYPQIGYYFDRDHSTVMEGVKRHNCYQEEEKCKSPI